MVNSVPDEAKGERLVLLHTDPMVSAGEAWKQLSATDMPKLWVPRQDAIFYVEAIPSLGTGKTDLKRARQMAQSLMLAPTASAE